MNLNAPKDCQPRACAMCMWWEALNSVTGHCKRMPPIRPDGEAEGSWPMTGRSDWCGEYAALRAIEEVRRD